MPYKHAKNSVCLRKSTARWYQILCGRHFALCEKCCLIRIKLAWKKVCELQLNRFVIFSCAFGGRQSCLVARFML